MLTWKDYALLGLFLAGSVGIVSQWQKGSGKPTLSPTIPTRTIAEAPAPAKTAVTLTESSRDVDTLYVPPTTVTTPEESSANAREIATSQQTNVANPVNTAGTTSKTSTARVASTSTPSTNTVSSPTANARINPTVSAPKTATVNNNNLAELSTRTTAPATNARVAPTNTQGSYHYIVTAENLTLKSAATKAEALKKSGLKPQVILPKLGSKEPIQISVFESTDKAKADWYAKKHSSEIAGKVIFVTK